MNSDGKSANATVIINEQGKILSCSKEETGLIKIIRNSDFIECLRQADVFPESEIKKIIQGFKNVFNQQRNQYAFKKHLRQGTYLRVRIQAMTRKNEFSVAIRVGEGDILEQIAHYFRNPLSTIGGNARTITRKSAMLEEILTNATTYLELKSGRYFLDIISGFDLYADVIRPAKENLLSDFSEIGMDVHHKYSIKPGEVTDLKADKQALVFVYRQIFQNVILFGCYGGRYSWGQEDEDKQRRLIVYSHTREFIPESTINNMFEDRGFNLQDNEDVENPDIRETLNLRLYNCRQIIRMHKGKMWTETGHDKKDNAPFLKQIITIPKT